MSTPPVTTCFCWNDTGDLRIFFFVLEGNYSNLDGIYINLADCPQSAQDQLASLVSDEDGEYKVERLLIPPKEYDYFIQCGVMQ